jgi:hypothetical protein
MKQFTSVVLLLLVGASPACRAKGHSPFQNVAAAKPVAAAPALKVPKVYPQQFAAPVGPPLAVLPGRGLGPLRFGASLGTVERLLGTSCTKKTTDGDVEHCLLTSYGVEVELREGHVSRLRVHGSERKFPGENGAPAGSWGAFNGSFKGAVLGMYAAVVAEQIGEPSSVQKLDPPEGATVMRHTYPHNTVLEYDKIANGNVVLASIVLDPDPQEIEAVRQAALAAVSANPGTPEAAPSQLPEPDSKLTKGKKRAKPRTHGAKP